MSATTNSRLMDEIARLRGRIEELERDHSAASAFASRELLVPPEQVDLYQHATVGLCSFDRDLRCLNVNATLAKLVSRAERECRGLSPQEIFPFESERIAARARDALQRDVEALELNHPRARADGTEQWYRFEFKAIIVDDCVQGVTGTISDVSDRRLAETSLLESEEKFRKVFESVPECVKLLARDGELLDMNAAGLAMIEAESIDDVRGESVYSLIAREYLDAFMANEEAVYRGESNSQVFEVIGLKGTRRWMETHQVPLVYSGKTDPVVLAVTRDISERKKVEEARLASERWFRSIFEQAGVAVGVIETRSGRIVRVNHKYEALLGYASGELVGHSWRDHTHPDDLQESLARVRQLIEGEVRDYSIEKRVIHKDGSTRWMNVTISPMWPVGDPPGEHIVIVQDVTKRKRGDAVLQGLVEGTASRTGDEFFGPFATSLATLFAAKYVLVCEHLDDPVTRVRTLAFWKHDRLGENMEYALSGSPCERTAAGEWSFFPTGIQERFPTDDDLVALQAESYCGIPLTDSSRRIIGHIAIMDDGPMTGNLCDVPALQVFTSRAAAELERRQTEHELRVLQDRLAHVSRVSTMGEMATGLAHELNQPLAAMLSYAYAGEQTLHDSNGSVDVEYLQELFEKLSGQAARAGEIIRRLRTLVGKRTAARARVDIEDPVVEVLALLDATLRRNEVQVDLKLDLQPCPVNIDEIQIQQVLVNIIRNAIDAMKSTEPEKRRLAIITSAQGAEAVDVAIQDSGEGLSEDELGRVFDAFVSSKPEGMGMGLAISRTIVESHGGSLSVASNPHRGVTFRIQLPLAKDFHAR